MYKLSLEKKQCKVYKVIIRHFLCLVWLYTVSSKNCLFVGLWCLLSIQFGSAAGGVHKSIIQLNDVLSIIGKIWSNIP